MPRLLAIDYGKKRTGIAVSDPLKIIANGLTTVDTRELISFLKKYFATEPVELVLIGMPKSLRNDDTHATPLVEKFIVLFKSTFPTIPILTLDERFTSKMAAHAISQSGKGKKERQSKGLVDKVSATLILQSYLDQQSQGRF